MGIFDILVKAAKERKEGIEELKESFDELDDEQLIRRYKSSSGNVKLACLMLLKERGYGNNELS